MEYSNNYPNRNRSRKKKRKEDYSMYLMYGILGFLIIVLIVVLLVALKKPKAKITVAVDEQQHTLDRSLEEKLGLRLPNGDPEDINTETETDNLEKIDQSTLKDTGSISSLKGLTEKGFVLEIKDGITYVDGLLIVNKTFALPESFVPSDATADLTGVSYSLDNFDKTTYEAFEKMKAEAAKEGIELKLGSGYRSYSCQVDLWKEYARQDSEAAADTYSARGGHSEHQSGLCFDLSPVSDSFTNTPAGRWVNDNCYKFGLCIRFPKGKEDITGYKYESWHCRYVGEELAAKLYNNGDWISLEEYFGLESKYNN